MAGESSSSSTRELDKTPTWAVASVCAVIIIISLSLEKILHKFGQWFTGRRKKALFEALEIVKSELMVLGFISLLLNFFQNRIVQICIPSSAANTMLPCRYDDTTDHSSNSDKEHGRKLLSAAASGVSKCKEGYDPIISLNGLHQIHILIFFLAIVHVLYSAITMLSGRLKIRAWKKWELETTSHDYEFSHDPARFRLTHETTFVRTHTSIWTRIPFLFYFGCFLRQFFRSVSKADYLTLRNGFITVHIAPGGKFDFQKYIKRSLEDDFKVVVGVSPLLWASFVIFLLLNVSGWQALFWASLIPLFIILLVGTKLQSVLTKMALEMTERHAVVQGMPLVHGSDKYFWFGRPQLVLHLIHFALFQNAFQITYFFWIWYSFGLKSCFHNNLNLVYFKVALGLAVLMLCSYITLPLYALVTQMGSTMKKSIFDEQTSKALKKWHMAVKKKTVQAQGDRAGRSPARSFFRSPSSSTMNSPSQNTLHRFKTTGHSTRSITYDDQEMSDIENDPTSLELESSTRILIGQVDDSGDIKSQHFDPEEAGGESPNQKDFSFVKVV